MRGLALALMILLSACATTASKPPAPAEQGTALDADPNSLQIEIGRYSALLGQVVEHTGVAYEHAGHDDGATEGPHSLQLQLNAAAADYNAVRAALCASKAGATTYAAIRAQSCTAGRLAVTPVNPILTYRTVAVRSHAAGEPIIGLWSDVCDEARRLQPADQRDEPVCPME